MSNIIFFAGLIITGLATIGLAVFAASQIRVRNEVKDIPIKFAEWKSQYRTRRFYFMLAQIGGLIIAFIGMML